jgi:hypothetical protein
MCGERLTVNFSIGSAAGSGPRTCAPVRLAVLTISRVDGVEHAVIERLEPDANVLAVAWGFPRQKSEKVVGISGGRRSLRLDPLIPYSMILATTPAPTVRPPSRMAKRSFSSMAIGTISSTSIDTLSPGITISVPSGSCHHAGHVGRAEVELRTVVGEERRVTAALFLVRM